VIDLHVHSYHSDGTDSPKELLHKAKELGVDVMSLTDHDTVDGLDEAITCASEYNLHFIPGIELSSLFKENEIHILGYKLDYKSPAFQEQLVVLKQKRRDRNQKMIEKFHSLGIEVSMLDMEKYLPAQIGRLHFANILIEKGYVKNIAEAFQKYLSPKGAVYFPRVTMNPHEAVIFLKSFRALSVLAHPHLYGFNKSELWDFCKSLKDAGLNGIEVYYPEHSPSQTEYYISIAKDLGLFVTGGSDFHGANIPGKTLGHAHNDSLIPDECAKYLM